MRQVSHILATALLWVAFACMAAGGSQDAAKQTAGGSTPRLSASSSVEEILDALHEVGQDLKSLEATVKLSICFATVNWWTVTTRREPR